VEKHTQKNRVAISTHINKDLLDLVDNEIKQPFSKWRSRSEWFNWFIGERFTRKAKLIKKAVVDSTNPANGVRSTGESGTS